MMFKVKWFQTVELVYPRRIVRRDFLSNHLRFLLVTDWISWRGVARGAVTANALKHNTTRQDFSELVYIDIFYMYTYKMIESLQIFVEQVTFHG